MNSSRKLGLSKFSLGVASVLLLALAKSAVAVTYTASFTVSNFSSPAPYSPITGSVTFEAASLSSPVTKVDAIDLTIGTFKYSLAGISYAGDGKTTKYQFGSPYPSSVIIGRDQFAFSFDPAPYSPSAGSQFLYSVSGATSSWSASGFPVTISVVPEPAVAYSMLLGVFSVYTVVMTRRRGIRSQGFGVTQ